MGGLRFSEKKWLYIYRSTRGHKTLACSQSAACIAELSRLDYEALGFTIMSSNTNKHHDLKVMVIGAGELILPAAITLEQIVTP